MFWLRNKKLNFRNALLTKVLKIPKNAAYTGNKTFVHLYYELKQIKLNIFSNKKTDVKILLIECCSRMRVKVEDGVGRGGAV